MQRRIVSIVMILMLALQGWNVDGQVDYETRRVYASLRTDLHEARAARHRIDTLQLGFVSGALIWRAQRLPCPVNPDAARACAWLRHVSQRLYAFAALLYVEGVSFAFVLPLW